MSRAEIPTEFGNREDLTKTGEKLQRAFKDRLTRARVTEEGGDFCTQNNIHFKCDITMAEGEGELELYRKIKKSSNLLIF